MRPAEIAPHPDPLRAMRERGNRAGSARWLRVPPFSAQAIVTLLILLVCGGLVVYPVVFLVEAALNTGDPQEFPLQEWGLANFAALGEDWHILANTALVACMATVMAVTFGFVVAWILTRTRVPGGARLERLMELPYYMTPLVGGIGLGDPCQPAHRGSEPGLARGRRRWRFVRHLFAVRHRLGHGAL